MAPKRQRIMDVIALRMSLIRTGTTEGGVYTSALGDGALTLPGTDGAYTEAGGGSFYSDLGLNVIESRPQLVMADGSIGRVPIESSECPCILVRDPLDTIMGIDLDGNEEHKLDLEFEIRHEGGAITDSDLRKMEQDVRTAIGIDTTWGGLARDTFIQSSEKILLQAEKIIGGMLIRGNVIFDTAAFAEE
mgnify:CR=1 FL=1